MSTMCILFSTLTVMGHQNNLQTSKIIPPGSKIPESATAIHTYQYVSKYQIVEKLLLTSKQSLADIYLYMFVL